MGFIEALYLLLRAFVASRATLVLPEKMSSIYMARRDRNQAKMDARRIETTGGMIGELIVSGE
jgi:hypothetical protein